jgi:hypothetical protein
MSIFASNRDEFEEKLRNYLQRDEFKSIKGIVYFWRVDKKIKRIKGESNILYIGKTTQTLRQRYLNRKSLEIELKCFDRFYKYVMKEYGSITIEIKSCVDTKHEELVEINKYSESHLEYPPLNRSIPQRK